MREEGRCRSCRADIEWARLNGKPHPFDVVPSEDGSHEIVETPTEVSPIAVYVPASKRMGRRLVKSHFATCPNAAEHRRR